MGEGLKRSVAWLVIPTVAILLALVIYPTVYLWYMMFFSYHPARDPLPVFVGLKNFEILAADTEAQSSILTMLMLVGITVPFELALGISLGTLFSLRSTRGKLGLKTLMLIPMMIPAVLVGINWRMIFFSYGPLSAFLSSIGIPPQPWLSAPFGNPRYTLFSLAILDVWQWTPFVALAIISGIEGVPKDVYEAAALDGASERQILLNIALPMIKGVIFIIFLLRLIDSLRIFDIIYMLTHGGPGIMTMTLPFYVFQTGFTLMSPHAGYGYASLLSLVLLGISMSVATVVMKVMHIERLIWE